MKHILFPLSRLLRLMRPFFKREDGTATVEFVILFPIYMILLVSAVESGVLMVRQVMLERGLDMTVRNLRLGNMTPPTHTELKRAICNAAGIIPDCMNSLLVDLEPVSKTTWTLMSPTARCVDRSSKIAPVLNVKGGGDNELMMVRVCAVFDPIFPTTGLGLTMAKDATGAYALVAASAFVNEPS